MVSRLRPAPWEGAQMRAALARLQERVSKKKKVKRKTTAITRAKCTRYAFRPPYGQTDLAPPNMRKQRRKRRKKIRRRARERRRWTRARGGGGGGGVDGQRGVRGASDGRPSRAASALAATAKGHDTTQGRRGQAGQAQAGRPADVLEVRGHKNQVHNNESG